MMAVGGGVLSVPVNALRERPPKALYRVGQHQHLVPDVSVVCVCPLCGERWQFVDSFFVRVR